MQRLIFHIVYFGFINYTTGLAVGACELGFYDPKHV